MRIHHLLPIHLGLKIVHLIYVHRDIQRLARVIFDDFGKKGRIIFFHRARAVKKLADYLLGGQGDKD